MGKNRKRTTAFQPRRVATNPELERASIAGMQTGVFMVKRQMVALRVEIDKQLTEAGHSEGSRGQMFAAYDAGLALVDAMHAEVERAAE